ncbi:Inner membrane transport protein YeaN [compost metagenome]
MSQSVGYLLAAAGPMAMGALHDAMGGWHIPLGICTALALIAAVMGALAGRDQQLAQ